MVDLDDLRSSAVKSKGFDYIYLNKTMPNNWVNFIGRTDSIKWETRYSNQGASLSLSPDIFNGHNNTHIPTVVMGNLVLHLFGADPGFPGLVSNLSDYASNLGLCILSNCSDVIDMSKLPILSDERMVIVDDALFYAIASNTRQKLGI